MIYDSKNYPRILLILACLMWASFLLPLLIASKGQILQTLWLYHSHPALYTMLLTPPMIVVLSKMDLSSTRPFSISASLYCCNTIALFRIFHLCRKGNSLALHFLQTVNIGVVVYFLLFGIASLLVIFSYLTSLLTTLSLEEFLDEETADIPFRIRIRK